MKTLQILIFLAIVLSCENANREYYGDDMEVIEEIVMTEQAPPPMEEPVSEVKQKLVKTGSLYFQSEDVETDYQKIRDMLPKFEAYIQNENQTRSSNQISYDLTVRVPSASYDTLYSALIGIVYRLENKYSNVSDVTDRFYDLKTRIRNKKALEDRYIKLLSKAKEIKDILEIERSINLVRTDIERMEGQFKLLSNQISQSTINLSFYEELPYVYDGTKRKGFGARILNSLDSGWQGLLSFIVGITMLWPFLLIITAGIIIFKKLRKTKK